MRLILSYSLLKTAEVRQPYQKNERNSTKYRKFQNRISVPFCLHIYTRTAGSPRTVCLYFLAMKDKNIIVIGSGKHVQYPDGPSFQNGSIKGIGIFSAELKDTGEQFRDGGPVELIAPIAIVKSGIDCLKEAIADLEQMPSETVRLRIADYIIKPDPIQGLPFSKELVKMMLQTQVELYQKQLEQLNEELKNYDYWKKRTHNS